MHYTDDEIWRLTPRKFKSQLDVHHDVQLRMHGSESKNKSGTDVAYIDQIPGW